MIKIENLSGGIPFEEIPYVVAQLLIIVGFLLIVNIILIVLLLWKLSVVKEEI